MKKNLLFLMLICLIFVQFDAKAQVPTTFWSNNATTTWYNGTDNAFTLTTASELASLAILVEGGNNFLVKLLTLQTI